MELRKISKWFLISGTLLILVLKYGVRPYWEGGEPVKFILGIAPNLLGSFLIPFGACWFFSGRENMVAKIFRIHSLQDLRVVCVLGFGMLTVNEYLQRVPFFGRTFDYYDILFSAAGLGAAYFVFAGIFNRIVYRYYPD
jgi:hypothetical protein